MTYSMMVYYVPGYHCSLVRVCPTGCAIAGRRPRGLCPTAAQSRGVSKVLSIDIWF